MKYYNVIVLILIILLVAVCTTGCSTFKTEHLIKIEHNITISLKPTVIDIKDSNGSKKTLSVGLINNHENNQTR